MRGAVRGALGGAVLLASVASASAQDYYGAIAYSQSTGSYGFSYDHPTRARAENGALSECLARANDCTVALWFRNACGALAIGAGGGWGTGWGSNRGLAESAAIQTCRRFTNSCSVVRWVCTPRQ